MIDISTLTRLQQVVVLLVERSGTTGMRQNELFTAAGGSQSRLKEALATLVKSQQIIRINDTLLKYYSPATAPISPLAAPISPLTAPIAACIHINKKEGKKEKVIKTTENILAYVSTDQMSKFVNAVTTVWKTLRCRPSEGFSPDLIHRIAYALISDDFALTQEWLLKMRDEADAAVKSGEVNKRWYLIANRLRAVYEYHGWWWTSCRPVFKAVETERLQSFTEKRQFRYDLYPMEKERTQQHFSKLEKSIEQRAATKIVFDKQQRRFVLENIGGGQSGSSPEFRLAPPVAPSATLLPER